MLLWRKLITGVAGGEREMAFIQATTINPESSYTEFMGTVNMLERNLKVAEQRAKYTLEAFKKPWSELSSEEKQAVQNKYPLIFQQEHEIQELRRGVDRKTGREVIQYSDGTIEYAN